MFTHNDADAARRVDTEHRRTKCIQKDGEASQAYLHGPVPAPGKCLAAPIIILVQGEEKRQKTPSLVCVSLNQSQPGGGENVRGTCFE